jgi:hypothetical protein
VFAKCATTIFTVRSLSAGLKVTPATTYSSERRYGFSISPLPVTRQSGIDCVMGASLEKAARGLTHRMQDYLASAGAFLIGACEGHERVLMGVRSLQVDGPALSTVNDARGSILLITETAGDANLKR